MIGRATLFLFFLALIASLIFSYVIPLVRRIFFDSEKIYDKEEEYLNPKTKSKPVKSSKKKVQLKLSK